VPSFLAQELLDAFSLSTHSAQLVTCLRYLLHLCASSFQRVAQELLHAFPFAGSTGSAGLARYSGLHILPNCSFPPPLSVVQELLDAFPFEAEAGSAGLARYSAGVLAMVSVLSCINLL